MVIGASKVVLILGPCRHIEHISEATIGIPLEQLIRLIVLQQLVSPSIRRVTRVGHCQAIRVTRLLLLSRLPGALRLLILGLHDQAASHRMVRYGASLLTLCFAAIGCSLVVTLGHVLLSGDLLA